MRRKGRAGVASTARPSRKRNRKWRERAGLSGGGVIRGGTPSPSAPPPSQFKRLVQGRERSRASCGRGSCTAPGPGACARAAPEPPAAPPAAPRVPPPGEPGTGQGSGREKGERGEGRKRKGRQYPAGLAGGVAGSRPPRPWPPPAPSWQSTARGVPAAQVFLLFAQIAGTKRKSPAGQQAAAKGRRAGGRVAGVGAVTSPRDLSARRSVTQTPNDPEAGLHAHRAPSRLEVLRGLGTPLSR